MPAITFKTRQADDRFEVYNTLNGRTAATCDTERTAQAIADAYNQPVAEIHARVVTRGELVEAFGLVEPAGGWKGRIDCLVSACDAEALTGASSATDGLERVRIAVAFLTGSSARYTESPNAGVWRLKSAGYYAAERAAERGPVVEDDDEPRGTTPGSFTFCGNC